MDDTTHEEWIKECRRLHHALAEILDVYGQDFGKNVDVKDFGADEISLNVLTGLMLQVFERYYTPTSDIPSIEEYFTNVKKAISQRPSDSIGRTEGTA